MFDTIIFDIDGTLLNSSKGIIAAVNYTIENLGLKKLNEMELFEFVSYSPLKSAFIYFCNVDNENSLKCCEMYRKYYKENTMFLADIYENIVNLLEFLYKNNFNLGVATFKNEENAKLLLQKLNLDKYFKYIVGASYEKEQSKDEILNTCIKRLKSTSQNTIFIGDSKSDAIAANNSGCGFIGVTYGFGFKNELDIIPYNPLFIAKMPIDIINYLKQNI